MLGINCDSRQLLWAKDIELLLHILYNQSAPLVVYSNDTFDRFSAKLKTELTHLSRLTINFHFLLIPVHLLQIAYFTFFLVFKGVYGNN